MLRPLFIHLGQPRDIHHRSFALDPHQSAYIAIGMCALIMGLRPKTGSEVDQGDNTVHFMVKDMPFLAHDRETQKERKSAISSFERYLTDSLQNDNLAGFAALTKTTNMNFVYHYYRARRQAATTDECKQLIEQYISDGRSWLEAEPRTSGWNYYIWVISLWTWDHHANTLMTPLLQKLPDNVKEDLISQLRQIQKEASTIYLAKWAAQMQYRQSLLLPLEK